jgi:hypothetical protein
MSAVVEEGRQIRVGGRDDACPGSTRRLDQVIVAGNCASVVDGVESASGVGENGFFKLTVAE